MQPFLKKLLLTSVIVLFISFISPAANAGETVPAAGAGDLFNPVYIGLITLIGVLLFAIAALAGVLRQLALVYRNKMRNERKNGTALKSVLMLFGFSLASLSAFAQEAAEEAEEVVKSVSSPFISGIPKSDFYALMFIIGLQLLIVFSMLLYQRTLLRLINGKEEAKDVAEKAKKRIPFLDRFNKAVAVEKEEEILLDHDYDGIKELDNSLPPWWKYGFYLTIVVSVIYLWYYHGGGNGPSSYDEYVAAIRKGEEEKAAYLAKTAGNIDETNVVMADGTGIEEGKTLFQKNCAACHGNDGGGSVGPNLADEYWLHGGSLADVFSTIKYGVPDKGMKSWKDDFSPRQIAGIASFVKTLKGTRPAAPKEKQGELYVEAEDAPAGADSTRAQQPVAVQ